ncbi:MAG: tRNA (adenosine(37)-N6)-threonylcarbamoyltransferase complex transferase subunit TsaD, partial [Vulcanococcus sp.]
MPTLLALETSCDESAAAVVRDQRVLASAVASQVEEHA